MSKVKITGVVENDIQVPNSRKHSTDTDNTFIYNVDGEFDKKARQAIKNTIEGHGGRNGFTALVTFNVKLS